MHLSKYKKHGTNSAANLAFFKNTFLVTGFKTTAANYAGKSLLRRVAQLRPCGAEF